MFELLFTSRNKSITIKVRSSLVKICAVVLGKGRMAKMCHMTIPYDRMTYHI